MPGTATMPATTLSSSNLKPIRVPKDYGSSSKELLKTTTLNNGSPNANGISNIEFDSAPLDNNTTASSLDSKKPGVSLLINSIVDVGKKNEKELTLISDINTFNWNIGNPLDPPPFAHFLSMDDLVYFCQISARHYGYAVSKSNSVPGKNIYLTCYPLGSYQGSTINKAAQKTVSMKVNRPFQLIGSVPMSKKVTSKTWTLEHPHRSGGFGPT
ncbi:hypothetical protein PCASD_02439 [Puccinia coronata f. sp. avenae]|uniref:Uncharacterized protein n=1 Tax=Puccinia coronata f. sp. avenae TaxID=200324 RepID=A0A2N5VM88_9BASI|nr:hypothetical protein PCASD_02439 [Puccinia coronata f. sp. avenae]